MWIALIFPLILMALALFMERVEMRVIPVRGVVPAPRVEAQPVSVAEIAGHLAAASDLADRVAEAVAVTDVEPVDVTLPAIAVA